jgi:8-amino-7-oxononanoate synthase
LDASLIYTDLLPGRTLINEEEEFLFFSGTSYLGIPHNIEFREKLVEGFIKYGTNYSSSRNSNLRLSVYEEVESYLSCWAGAEAALTLSSGFMAGQVVIQSLKDDGHFMYAPCTHPALWRFETDASDSEQDFDEWVTQLLTIVEDTHETNIILVCNSLDPLKVRNHSFEWIAKLPVNKNFTLIIDDSHGFGITGLHGEGCFSQVRQYSSTINLIVLGSLGKAMGIPAGVVLSDKQLIDKIKSSPIFGGSSPAVPAYLYALLKSRDIFAESRKKLLENILYFETCLQEIDLFSAFNNYPVFSTSHQELYNYLIERRVMISSFKYPTPDDAPFTRLVLNSLHTKNDISQLAGHISQFAEILSLK